MTPEQRLRALFALSKYTGFEVTADFLRHTFLHCPSAGITAIHSLIEGIFKPRNSRYAFTIWSRISKSLSGELVS